MMRTIQMAVACVAVLIATAGQVQAGFIGYTITVNVTAADVAPGSFDSNPWSFSSVPSSFLGTFDADDTVVGGISNLVLTVGGLDIAVSHPVEAVNSFDPNTLILSWSQIDPSFSGFKVGFGPIGLLGTPSNYAVAVERSFRSPRDPFYQSPQNWVGTYSIAPSTAPVPEPSSLALFAIGACVAGLGPRRRRRGKQQVAIA